MKEKSDSKDIYSIIKIFQINTSLFYQRILKKCHGLQKNIKQYNCF